MGALEQACEQLRGNVIQGESGRYEIGDRMRPLDHEWVFDAVDLATREPVTVMACHPGVVGGDSARRFLCDAKALVAATRAAAAPCSFSRALDAVVLGPPHDLGVLVLEPPKRATLALTLRAARRAGLRAAFVRRVIGQLSYAVTALHEAGFTHGRITPGNVWLDGEHDQVTVTLSVFRRFTHFRTHAATPGAFEGERVVFLDPEEAPYMAPEAIEAAAARGDEPKRPERELQWARRVSAPVGIVCAASDVFSLAVLAFEMLTGQRPYGARDTWATGHRTLGPRRSVLACLDPSAASGRGAPFFAELEAVFARALAEDMMVRQRSASDLWNELVVPLAGVRRLRRAPKVAPAPAPAPPAAKVRTDPSPHSGVRPRPTPPAWTWTRWRPAPVVLHAACFSRDGERVLAVGPGGLFAWSEGAWKEQPLPPLGPRRLRAVTFAGRDEVVVAGDDLLLCLGPGGAVATVALPWARTSVQGVVEDPSSGRLVLVGHCPAEHHLRGRVGFFAGLCGTELDFTLLAPASTVLSAVARVGDARYLACGEDGAIAALERGKLHERRAELQRAPAHLLAIAGNERTAFAVGGAAGVVALRADGKVRFEGVPTDQWLTSIAMDETGEAWAGAARGLVLRRRDGAWEAAAQVGELRSPIVALWASQRRVRAVYRDGAFSEGS